MRFCGRIAAAFVAAGLCCTATVSAQDPTPVTFERGDVFLSVGGGVVYVFRDFAGTRVYDVVR